MVASVFWDVDALLRRPVWVDSVAAKISPAGDPARICPFIPVESRFSVDIEPGGIARMFPTRASAGARYHLPSTAESIASRADPQGGSARRKGPRAQWPIPYLLFRKPARRQYHYASIRFTPNGPNECGIVRKASR